MLCTCILRSLCFVSYRICVFLVTISIAFVFLAEILGEIEKLGFEKPSPIQVWLDDSISYTCAVCTLYCIIMCIES